MVQLGGNSEGIIIWSRERLCIGLWEKGDGEKMLYSKKNVRLQQGRRARMQFQAKSRGFAFPRCTLAEKLAATAYGICLVDDAELIESPEAPRARAEQPSRVFPTSLLIGNVCNRPSSRRPTCEMQDPGRRATAPALARSIAWRGRCYSKRAVSRQPHRPIGTGGGEEPRSRRGGGGKKKKKTNLPEPV